MSVKGSPSSRNRPNLVIRWQCKDFPNRAFNRSENFSSDRAAAFVSNSDRLTSEKIYCVEAIDITAAFWISSIDVNLTPKPSGVTLTTSPAIQTVFSKLEGKKETDRFFPRVRALRVMINAPPRLMSRITPLESPAPLV